jgi:hypothetical protein
MRALGGAAILVTDAGHKTMPHNIGYDKFPANLRVLRVGLAVDSRSDVSAIPT